MLRIVSHTWLPPTGSPSAILPIVAVAPSSTVLATVLATALALAAPATAAATTPPTAPSPAASAAAPTAPPPPPELVIPADFERHPALLVGASQMIFHHRQAFLDIVAALDGAAEVLGLVGNRAQARHLRALLRDGDLAPDAVTPVVAPVQSMWIRDFGPVFVRDSAGQVGVVDARYGGTEDNPDDEYVPRALARRWRAPLIETEMWLEGGQILSNGSGLLLVSTALFTKNAAIDGIDGEEATARLQRSLPFTHAEVVQPLRGERTGHIDMFMAFLDVDLLLIARIDPTDDPVNAARLDAHAARLEGTPTTAGPLRVVRVDTPAATDGTFRTYTNTAMAGDVVLVPCYPDVDPAYDTAALDLYRRHFPDREVVGIDARSLVARRGALHCVSMPVPLDPPSVRRPGSGGTNPAAPLSGSERRQDDRKRSRGSSGGSGDEGQHHGQNEGEKEQRG